MVGRVILNAPHKNLAIMDSRSIERLSGPCAGDRDERAGREDAPIRHTHATPTHSVFTPRVAAPAQKKRGTSSNEN